MRAHHQPIAVIGLSAIFPGSDDLAQYWRTILDGQDHIGPVPATHWRLEDYVRPERDAQDHTWASQGGFLNPQPFDPLAFGIPPQLLEATDSAQLLTLIATERLLQDAYQGRFGQVDRSRMGVILGVTAGQPLMNSMASRLEHPIWARSMRAHGLEQPQIDAILETIAAHYVPWQEASFPGLLGNVVAGRVANRFDLHGINCVVDAACGSSLGALALAIDELALGRADVMITGGVDTFNDIFMYVCFSRTHALSKRDQCRPFDAEADGTLLGEGVGLVALKRLEDALRDKDPIYAVIKGVGASSDGKAKSIYAPLPQGQRRAIMRAYEQADFEPSSIGLIEAHGTGTRAGDAAELEGLHSVFGEVSPGLPPSCAVGSVKSQIGHTKAAAGTAGLIKAILSLHQRVLPATIKVSQENPALPQGSKLYINTTTRPWVSDGAHPRRAGVSAFGFGGSNFHVALEEHTGPGRALAPVTVRDELLTLGAMSAQALCDKIKETLTQLDAGHSVSQIARRTQTQVSAQRFSHRLSLIGGASADELRARLRRALAMIEINPNQPNHQADGTSYGFGQKTAKVALLCAGLEPVSPEAGRTLAIEQPQALDLWDRLATLHAQGRLERAPHARRFAPKGASAQDDHDAVALIEANLALAAAQLEVLRATQLKLERCAGFNTGELLALYAAGMIDLERLMRVGLGLGRALTSHQGQHQALMVMASLEQLEPWLGRWPQLSITAQDHERQLTVSGSPQAIEALASALHQAQIITKPIASPVTLHHPSLGGVSKQLDRLLAQWPLRSRAQDAPALYDPERGVAYPDDLEQLKAHLSAHLSEPRDLQALWRGLMRDGADVILILGHEDTLSASLQRLSRISRHDVVIAPLGRCDEHERLTLLKALGKLYAAGASMQLEPLWAHLRPQAAPVAPTKPRQIIPISGANHNKRYPAAKPEDDPLFGRVIPRPKPKQAAALEYELLDRADEAAMTQHKSAQHTPVDPAWLAAFQETQRQMVEAHARFQEALTEGHRAFLEAMEHAQTQLAAVMSAQGQTPPSKTASPMRALTSATSQPSVTSAPPAPAAPKTPTPPQAPPRPKPLGAAPTPPQKPTTPQKPQPPTTAPASKPSTARLAETLLSIVSQKTGYPESMLTLDLELEGDLGIDSIKRVEIFSALKDAVPTLPELDGSQMAQLSSLQSILDAVASLPSASTTAAAPSPPHANGHSHGPTDAELTATLLSIVSQKTGYPESMLTLDLELEGDLGIDSIKRVEIFSALKDAVPTLPELDGSQMAQLSSLQDILSKLKATIQLGVTATGAAAFF